jgi:hypothetical protein
MEDEWRVNEQESKRSESLNEQADQPSRDVWWEVEKLKREIDSLLGDRIRERSQVGITGSEDIEPKERPSAPLQSPLKSLRLDSPDEVGSMVAGSSSRQKAGKEVELPRKLTPVSRLFPIDASKDATLIFAGKSRYCPTSSLCFATIRIQVSQSLS